MVEIYKKLFLEGENLKLKELKKNLTNIKAKEQNISNNLFKHYFTKYQSTSNMCKKLSDPKSTVNEFQLKPIKEKLAKLKKITENSPKNEKYKITENKNVMDIVELILYFDEQN